MIRDPAGEGKRYYAEYVRVASGDSQQQLQTLLDEKDDRNGTWSAWRVGCRKVG